MPVRKPAPPESGYDEESHRRIRQFIHEGEHPESVAERFMVNKPALPGGQPFPFAGS